MKAIVILCITIQVTTIVVCPVLLHQEHLRHGKVGQFSPSLAYEMSQSRDNRRLVLT